MICPRLDSEKGVNSNGIKASAPDIQFNHLGVRSSLLI